MSIANSNHLAGAIYLSIHPSISIYLSIHPYIYPSNYLSIYISIYLYPEFIQKNPISKVLVYPQDKVIGFLVFRFRGRSLCVLQLAVAKDVRGRGAGRSLLRWAAREARISGKHRWKNGGFSMEKWGDT